MPEKHAGRRILAVDGRALPPFARFKILSYHPRRNDGLWSFGPCTLDVYENLPAAHI
jgi:hypothetical protein